MGRGGIKVHIRVLGAGYGGLRAALDLDRWLGDREGVEITLIDHHDYHQLITELHKPAAGSASERRLAVPLREILRGTRIHFLQRRVKDILPEEDAVLLEGGTVLRYHRLVVALGGTPEYFNIPGVEENALTLRSINSARRIREHVHDAFQRAAQAEGAERAALLTVVVAGGGFTGVEVAGELADRLPRIAREYGIDADEVRVITVEAMPELLQGFSPPLVQEATRALRAKKVELMLGVPITGVEPGLVRLQDGREIPAGTVIWSGGVRGHPIVERRFPHAARGRAKVNGYLQSPAFPDVYLIGDCAWVTDPATGQPVAPTAQHAIEQGRIAARNIWAEYTGRKLRPYRPVSKGVVVSVGRGVGLARLGPYDVYGAGAAVLKDAIPWLYLYSLGGYRLVLRYALSLMRGDGTVEAGGDRQAVELGEARNGKEGASEGQEARRFPALRPGELPPGATPVYSADGSGEDPS